MEKPHSTYIGNTRYVDCPPSLLSCSGETAHTEWLSTFPSARILRMEVGGNLAKIHVPLQGGGLSPHSLEKEAP
jgi:hypothetical protein